jgi:hypothetical protein
MQNDRDLARDNLGLRSPLRSASLAPQAFTADQFGRYHAALGLEWAYIAVELACASQKRLAPLKGLTPYEYICRAWTKEPGRFTLNPLQQMPGLNI